jgi:hypothetical protein
MRVSELFSVKARCAAFQTMQDGSLLVYLSCNRPSRSRLGRRQCDEGTERIRDGRMHGVLTGPLREREYGEGSGRDGQTLTRRIVCTIGSGMLKTPRNDLWYVAIVVGACVAIAVLALIWAR